MSCSLAMMVCTLSPTSWVTAFFAVRNLLSVDIPFLMAMIKIFHAIFFILCWCCSSSFYLWPIGFKFRGDLDALSLFFQISWEVGKDANNEMVRTRWFGESWPDLTCYCFQFYDLGWFSGHSSVRCSVICNNFGWLTPAHDLQKSNLEDMLLVFSDRIQMWHNGLGNDVLILEVAVIFCVRLFGTWTRSQIIKFCFIRTNNMLAANIPNMSQRLATVYKQNA